MMAWRSGNSCVRDPEEPEVSVQERVALEEEQWSR